MILFILQILAFAAIGAAALHFLPMVDNEIARATLVAWPTSIICRTTAGVATLYVIGYDDIDHNTGVTWDASDVATALPLVATKTWFKVPFDRDTCSFNQEIAQVGRKGIAYTQTITWKITDDSAAVRLAQIALDGCCDLVAYMVLNNGNIKLAGILPQVPGGGTASKSLQMSTGPGFINSGADANADESERQYTLICTTNTEGVFTSVAESTLVSV